MADTTMAAPAGRIRLGLALTLAGAALWTLLWALFPAATTHVDEVVYFAGIAALVDHGRLTLENGAGLPPSPDLRLLFLRDGPNGLTPQYPPGLTVLAAPFFALMGIKGISAVNLLGGLASLGLTWSIARCFAPARVAWIAVTLLYAASFLVDYAVGAVWPHALALAFALAAVRAAIACSGPDRALRPLWALAGGLALGIGISVRVDVALIAPGLALWFLLTAARPYAHGVVATLGLLPPMAAMAWANSVKFGSWNPISYGSSGGGTDPSSHLPVLTAFAVAGAGVVIWRHAPRARRWLTLVPLLVVVVAPAAIPEVRAAALRTLHGMWLLLVDLSTHPEVGVRPGVVRDEYGMVTFWGLPKKALVQSLPWLGLLPLLALREVRAGAGRGLLLTLLISLSVVLPYAFLRWHGGNGGNMRYFLHFVPLLCFVGALAIHWLTKLFSGAPSRNDIILSIFLIMALSGVGIVLPDLAGTIVENWISLALAVALFCIASAAVVHPGARPALRPLVVAAVSISAFNAYARDLPVSFGTRSYAADVAVAYANAPVTAALFYDRQINGVGPILRNDRQSIASPSHVTDIDNTVDGNLIRAAVAADMAIVTRQPDFQMALERFLTSEDIPFTTETVPGRHPLTVTRARGANG